MSSTFSDATSRPPAPRDDRLRVLLLTPQLHQAGGVCRFSRDLALNLPDANVVVATIGAAEMGRNHLAVLPGIGRPDNIAVIDAVGPADRGRIGSAARFRTMLRARSLISAFRPHVIVAIGGHTHRLALALVARRWRRRTAIVVFEPSTGADHEAAAGDRFDRMLLRAGAHPLTATESVRNALARELPDSAAERLRVLPLGVDAPKTAPPQHPRSRAPETLTILAIGRLVGSKRFSDTIELVTALRSTGIDARASIVGNGPLGDELRRQAARQGVDDFVDVPGFVEDLEPLWATADILHSPSGNEGFGLVIADAMARGVPVVAARSLGAVELLHDGPCGWLHDIADVAGAVACVRRIVTQPAETARTLDRAVRRAHDDLGAEAMGHRWQAVLEDIAKRHPSPLTPVNPTRHEPPTRWRLVDGVVGCIVDHPTAERPAAVVLGVPSLVDPIDGNSIVESVVAVLREPLTVDEICQRLRDGGDDPRPAVEATLAALRELNIVTTAPRHDHQRSRCAPLEPLAHRPDPDTALDVVNALVADAARRIAFDVAGIGVPATRNERHRAAKIIGLLRRT